MAYVANRLLSLGGVSIGRGQPLPEDIDPQTLARLIRRNMVRPEGQGHFTLPQKLTAVEALLRGDEAPGAPVSPDEEPAPTPAPAEPVEAVQDAPADPEPAPEPTPEPEPTEEPDEEPSLADQDDEALTKADIRQYLDELGVTYSKRDSKDELLAALEAAREE